MYINLKNINIINVLEIILDNDNLELFLNNFDIVNKDKQYIFEYLCELFVLFNIIDKKNIQLLSGDSQRIKNYSINFSNGVRSGSKEGIADIKYKYNNNIYLGSVKYFLNFDKKDLLNSFDLEKIFCRYNNIQNKIFFIFTNIENKNLLYNKRFHDKDNKIKFIKDNIKKENIYDLNDINKFYILLKNKLSDNNFNNINKKKLILKLSNNKLKNLVPYYHQYVIVKELMKKFKIYDEILLNAICRCGKTFISGLLTTYMKYKRILLITPRITSTKNSYNRMLDNYNEFVKYKKIIYDNEKNNEEIILDKENEHVFLTLSRQLIIDRNKKIDYSYFDLIILDEAHLISNGKIDKNINLMKKSGAKILYMTGTSDKVENKRCLDEDKIIRYSLDHIDNYKNGNLDYDYSKGYYEMYNEKYGLIKRNIIDYYNKLPKMKYHYIDLKKMTKENNKKVDFLTEYGFSFSKLFELKNNNLKNKEIIENIFNMLFGKKEIDGEYLNENIINNINEESKNDYENNVNLVFLHYGDGIPIGKTAPKIKNLLENDNRISCNYEIHYYCSNSKNGDYRLPNDIVEDIERRRLEIKKVNKSLIILLGGML